MATPNLANVATIKPFMKAGALTTSYATLVDTPSESCFKVDSFYVSNVDGTNSATCQLEVGLNAGSGGNYALTKDLVVPPGATIAILTTPLYLDETDYIRGLASANSDLQWFASGTELID